MTEKPSILLKLLHDYDPVYPEEIICKEKMLELIDKCQDCFFRSCVVPGHFTASAFLLNKDMTHVCLTHHAKLDKWIQLGGHCDGDADIINVSIKEAKEESGIEEIRLLKDSIFDIDMHLIPSNSREETHYHFDVRFLLHAYNNNILIKNHESKALEWVEKNTEDSRFSGRSILRMFRKWKSIKTM